MISCIKGNQVHFTVSPTGENNCMKFPKGS